jgi:hypothetical protein
VLCPAGTDLIELSICQTGKVFSDTQRAKVFPRGLTCQEELFPNWNGKLFNM